MTEVGFLADVLKMNIVIDDDNNNNNGTAGNLLCVSGGINVRLPLSPYFFVFVSQITSKM